MKGSFLRTVQTAAWRKWLVTLALLVLLLTLLVGAMAIPRTAIEENVLSSAEYYRQYAIRRNWLSGVEQSKEDIYADAVLMNIALCADAEHPLRSALDARYYSGGGYMGESLWAAAEGDLSGNTPYSRYWHGSLIFIRPLLSLTDVSGLRLLSNVILAALVLVFLAACLRERLPALAVAYATAFLLTRSWYVPLSLEYMPCYLISLLSATAALYAKPRGRPLLFLLTGLCTAFFDFLTTETMTLLLPLLVLWALARKERPCPLGEQMKTGVGLCAHWVVGYAGTFLAKWTLASLVLGRNVFIEAFQWGGEKVVDALPVNIPFGHFGAALFYNLAYLFSTKHVTTVGGVLGRLAGIAIGLFVLWFLLRKARAGDYAPASLLLLLIALVPYLRYLVLANHAYVHAFMTYRAQLPSLMALLLFLSIALDRRWLQKRRLRRWK